MSGTSVEHVPSSSSSPFGLSTSQSSRAHLNSKGHARADVKAGKALPTSAMGYLCQSIAVVTDAAKRRIVPSNPSPRPL